MNIKMLAMILVLALIPAAGYSMDSELLNDFVTLDQAYVPVLFLTNMEKLNPSKESMQRLNQVWSTFKDKYYTYNSDDSQWKKDLDKIDQIVREASGIVTANGNLIAAHETLEEVRYTLFDTRRRNGIDYFVDYLTDFHDPMEHIVLRAKGKTPQTLTDDDIADIEESLPHTMALWHKVINANFDKALYGFDGDKYDQMQATIQAETQSLEELKSALNEKSDKEMIIKKSMGIKKNFAQLFSMFGNFQGLK